MDKEFARGAPSRRLSSRDVAIAIAAVMAIVFANVGVVRALDIALDALHR